MICVLQCVSRAAVRVAGKVVGAIGPGYVALIGVARGDTPADVDYICRKIIGLRLWADGNGKTNLTLAEAHGAHGAVLAISQFTLLADTRRGLRPSFDAAAPPWQISHTWASRCCLQVTATKRFSLGIGTMAAWEVAMPPEATISRPVHIEGVGLHSGAQARLQLLPAAAGSVIQFRRVDLDGFVVEARSANIAKVSYATSLMKKAVFISTTEHLLSALVGAGIDNVVAELDNLEVPILDGSALPYMEMIEAARPKRQHRRRKVLRIVRALEMREGEKFIGIYPASSGYTLHYQINFPHPVIGRQRFALELTPANYRRELAPARTFGFLADFAAMRRQGLIRGGSLDNAVVLDDQRVVNGELRFRDEFVRHKMLDLIGDLALLGAPLEAEVVADRAGHALHTALVQRLLANRRHWEWAEAEAAPEPRLPAAAAASVPVYTD